MTTSSAPLQTLERVRLFFGGSATDQAYIYAELPRDALPSGAELTGTVSGPLCRHAHTLIAAAPLIDQGAGPTLLARALVTEPCGWSPQSPHRYRVRVELTVAGELRAAVEREVGIRRLGTDGTQLAWDGKPWVLRAARQNAVAEGGLTSWRRASMALFADDPTDELCREASEEGVLILARLAGAAEQVATSVERLARWASVGVVIVEASAFPTDDPRSLARNLLLAAAIESSAGEEVHRPPPWAHLLLRTWTEPSAREVFRGIQRARPLLVIRPAGPQATPQAARSACDHLQRDLAPWTQAAGYIV